METKYKVVAALAVTLTAFASGRYTAPEKVRVETKTVEVEKKVTDSQVDTDKHRVTRTTVIARPDGTKETKTTTVEDSSKKADIVTKDATTTKSDTVSETTRRSSKVTVSGLVGASISDFSPTVYGVSLTKPVLGPLTTGVFGLSNGVVGFSLGLTF